MLLGCWVCKGSEWVVEFYDGLWVCESAVRSGSCEAIRVAGDMLQDLSRRVF